MKTKCMRDRRRGSLLIQQLILIAISGMVMMLAIKLIQQSFRFASVYQNSFNDQRVKSLLARQFRTDVHEALTANLVDENQLELKTLSHSRVVYRIDTSRIIREVWNESQAENAKERSDASNAYKLLDTQSARLSLDDRLVTLSIEEGLSSESVTELPHKRLTLRAATMSSFGSVEPSPEAVQKDTSAEEVSDDQ
ncbi:hypothetical protein SH449x_001933 [Pirellulaceae bacterium SH449]